MDDQVLLNLLVEFADVEERLAAAEYAHERQHSRTRDLSDLQAEYAEEAADAVRDDQSAKAQLRSKELEIKAAEAALAQKREQVIGVSDRRQHQALKDEITGLGNRLEQMEDEAIALLMALERTESQREESVTDSAHAALRREAELEKLDSAGERAKSALPHIRSEVDRLLAMMPEATRRHVERLRKNGEAAIARVQSGACGGCFGQLTPQQGSDAERGRGLVKCPNCARYVVHHQWR